ncbi:MAG: CsgG/HfaB family protein [candidate division WOR-3 bacterium]
MKKIIVSGCALAVLGLSACVPPAMVRAIEEYQATATLSPSFDLSKTYRLAVLPPEYTAEKQEYTNILEIYYESDGSSDVQPNDVIIDGKNVGSMSWTEDRFTIKNIAPGSHSVKVMAFMGDALADGRFYIGQGERLVLRASRGTINVDSRTRLEQPAQAPDPSSYLMDALNRDGMKAGFSVVERSKVETILNEQEFGYSGAVDPSTAAKLGKLMGADAVLISQASDKYDPEYESWEVTLSGRIVSVETGEILYTCRARGGGMDKAHAAEQASSNFFKEIRKARGGQ